MLIHRLQLHHLNIHLDLDQRFRYSGRQRIPTNFIFVCLVGALKIIRVTIYVCFPIVLNNKQYFLIIFINQI